MKKVLLLTMIILSLFFAQIQFILAHDDIDLCEHHSTGKSFGQHVSEHAREGHFNGDMNPGMHQGFSPCVP